MTDSICLLVLFGTTCGRMGPTSSFHQWTTPTGHSAWSHRRHHSALQSWIFMIHHAHSRFRVIRHKYCMMSEIVDLYNKSKLQEKIRGQRMNGCALRFNVWRYRTSCIKTTPQMATATLATSHCPPLTCASLRTMQAKAVFLTTNRRLLSWVKSV